MNASNINHLWAGLLVEELVRCGVECFFIAPGSRSTPLTVAVARHERARSILHYDERAAAFAALGYGRSTGRPAGWITTSGTAVANGMPAAVEAATDGVPLLLLTADRPPEKRDTGANQTIDQPGLFGEYVRWEGDLPTPTTEIAPAMVLTTASQAVHFARRQPPGPVHLNCMFRKPLAPEPDGRDYTDYLSELRDWQHADRPYTQRPVAASAPSPDDVQALADALKTKKRGLVVCGRLDTAREAHAARRLSEALDWPLIPDATSRLCLATGDSIVAQAGSVLASEAFEEGASVEAVLHLGGRSVSKRLRLFLKACRPGFYAVARPDARRLDPDHRVTMHVETEIATLARALIERLNGEASPPSDWTRRWQRANSAAGDAIEAFCSEADTLTEPLVARRVSQHCPAESALVLGSSMPVRDFNRYAAPGEEGGEPPDYTPVYANRGASGIDGTIATAVGVSEGHAEKKARSVTLLIGDLALLHDLNALALLGGRAVTVVALNNGGGGIFHFLPIAEHEDVFEPHFTTPHGLSFEHAAAMFGLAYDRPATPEGFVAAYRERSRSGESALIEVRTDRAENRAVHRQLDERIARAVQASMEP